MKKRMLLIAIMLMVALLAFTACGSSGGDSSDAQDGDAGTQTEDAEPGISPYAWLGLQDMPECNYLDVLSTYHYYLTYDTYTLGIKSEGVEAMDGVNSFTENAGTKTYSIEGQITSVNDTSKIYMEYDMTDLVEDEKARMEGAQTSGEDITGRHFLGTGKGIIPEYSETSGDTAEYEYYEYDYPETEEAGTGKIIERFYMKDGDVFAVYKLTTIDDDEIGYTMVIKNMSGDIPAGTFELPDLSGYTKY